MAILAAAVALLSAAGVALAIGTRDEEGAGAPPARGSATAAWRALAPATVARGEVAAARIGRYIYVVGGFQDGIGVDSSDALERYDIRRNRWRRLRPLPVGVNHPDRRGAGREAVRARRIRGAPHRPVAAAVCVQPPQRSLAAGCPTPASRARPTRWPL